MNADNITSRHVTPPVCARYPEAPRPCPHFTLSIIPGFVFDLVICDTCGALVAID